MNSGSMPGPVSRTAIVTESSVASSATVMRPAGGVNFTALEMKFPMMVSSAASSMLAAHAVGPA